jgi:hypothetical protein
MPQKKPLIQIADLADMRVMRNDYAYAVSNPRSATESVV